MGSKKDELDRRRSIGGDRRLRVRKMKGGWRHEAASQSRSELCRKNNLTYTNSYVKVYRSQSWRDFHQIAPTLRQEIVVAKLAAKRAQRGRDMVADGTRIGRIMVSKSSKFQIFWSHRGRDMVSKINRKNGVKTSLIPDEHPIVWQAGSSHLPCNCPYCMLNPNNNMCHVSA